MTEKIKPYLQKGKEFFGKIPKKILIAAIVALVLVAGVITFVLNNRPYTVLFTELNTEEATAIMSHLDQMGMTDYRLENNNTIMVPKSMENQLKAQLLTEGYPKSGFAYSGYYERVSALSTESERSRAFLISLCQWMESVIECLDGVKEAHVQIDPGEDRSYVLDSGNVVDATASVMVVMQNGQELQKKQADAIRNLVAHGVKGLKVDTVYITDSYGNTYNAGDGTAVSSEASELKLRLEQEYNNKITSKIMQALIPVYGEDNVRVAVNTTVDVNHSIENSTDVTLPPWAADGSTNGAGIIGSKVWDDQIIRNPEGNPGGTVGTGSNADLPTYVEPGLRPDGTEQEFSSSGQIDYDNPRSETYVERVAGYISDCMVSVTINSTTAGEVNVEAIRQHVARASGIEEQMAGEKISILPIPFYNPDANLPIGPDPSKPMTWVLYAAIGGLILFLVLLIVILLVLRARRRKKAAALAQEELPAQILVPVSTTPEGGVDVMTMQSERSMELRKDIRKFADENPEITAQLVRSWLRGGEEDG